MTHDAAIGEYRLGWHDDVVPLIASRKGLDADVVREISRIKSEPEWMTRFRLRALARFERKPMLPWFAVNMPALDFDDVHYYLKPTTGTVTDWELLPPELQRTYERLGIPQAERRFLAGVSAMYDSETVYHRNREDLERRGVVFCSMDQAVRDHPELVRRYFGTVVPPGDNKFAALNSAVWSGGSFVHVPAGERVELPLQAYFRINAERAGQFERTLIIAEEGASVHYVEGCSAPLYRAAALHSAVVELVARPGASIRYSTIQNWSPNVYNLVTKRARAEAESRIVWIDGNLGSQLTMKYPSVVLVGPKAHGEVLSLAYAGRGQHQDAGAKMIHAAPETTSLVTSKSVVKDGGRTTYRGLVRVERGARAARGHVRCDALLLDDTSRSDTYPHTEVFDPTARIGHEATVSKVSEEQVFYLRSRGLTEAAATAAIVNGFVAPVTETLPMEYAVELNRLVELNVQDAVG